MLRPRSSPAGPARPRPGRGASGPRRAARLAGRGVAGLAGLAAGLLAVQGVRLAGAVTMVTDHAAYWRRRRRAPGSILLVALGDSLAQGLGARRPERSWAGRLADALEADTGRDVRVVCLGVCGATTDEVLAEQWPQVPEAARRGDPDTLIAVCTGTNDATVTDPEAYRDVLGRLADRLPAGSLVADIPDFQRGRDRPKGAALAAVAREVAAARPGLVPVALEAATRRLRPWELGPDLAHPSGLGYRRFGRAFAAARAAGGTPTSGGTAGITPRASRAGSPPRSR